eukprot:CAMPEP_0116137782 /NCGR_PEP_ID=MMETSP0329-20121206/12426_1 /TAXON_ID=697910 /ORGANISM="Pseudo-nitzschia arenysensis, Strain B593" /LENGTH=859 /DNA_ID=CAMNT_0003632709 /DNA_START=56 /DNA_END=2635 /DNA_ORIENTATION=-
MSGETQSSKDDQIVCKKVTSSDTDGKDGSKKVTVTLCASCDRCRARKTKCDGKRPCGNCAAKYMKKHKLNSIEGIDIAEFDCVYSPAKRRGPVPGRAGQTRKASEAFSSQQANGRFGGGWSGIGSSAGVSPEALQSLGVARGMLPSAPQSIEELHMRQMMMAQMNGGGASSMMGMPGQSGISGMGRGQAPESFLNPQQKALQQELLLQQLQAQQMAGGPSAGLPSVTSMSSVAEGRALQRMKLDHQPKSQLELQQQQLQLQREQQQAQQQQQQAAAAAAAAQQQQQQQQQQQLQIQQQAQQQHSQNTGTDANGVPKTIAAHTHLLELSDPDGSRLRAYYRLSVDEVFGFPPTPTDEEYCARLNIPGMTPRMIPGTHLAALSAARFAEVALGAIVHNETPLAMELCNAVVHCLKESVQEPVQPPYMFEVARSYFLLAVFRSFRGDMIRYFKYRRVCLTYVSKLENASNATTLVAAVSFLDAWAYMIYNADEKKVPRIDHNIPPVERTPHFLIAQTPIEKEYNIRSNPGCIASDPRNQNWIQGAPPVFLNDEAPLRARSLDALACAVRTCCDQANGRFAAISKEAKANNMEPIPQETIITPTTAAVLAHENNLCSRNMVLSAFALLQQYEQVTPSSHKNQGIHLVMSAMDAFLDSGDEDEQGGFTDSQIQSLLSVANIVIENPLLLHHAGPTYHMVSNAAVMLCHLLNSMYMMKGGAPGIQTEQLGGGMEAAMFEEILDTFTALRKLLVIHRRKLPIKLRCHSIPRPSLIPPTDGKPFIDLGETLLCACRGCQGFVLMACTPVVAAQKAQAAATKRSVEAAREAQVEAADEVEKTLVDLNHDFNVDDDALLGMLSQLIPNR